MGNVNEYPFNNRDVPASKTLQKSPIQFEGMNQFLIGCDTFVTLPSNILAQLKTKIAAIAYPTVHL